MTWLDRYLVGAWLALAGCGTWASVTGAPTWVLVVLVIVCAVHILLVEATNGWAALRSLRSGIMRVVARFGGASPSADIKVAKRAVAELLEELAAAEARCRGALAPSDETMSALREMKAGVEELGAKFGQFAADYEGEAISLRKMESDLSVAATRVELLLAALYDARCHVEEIDAAEREMNRGIVLGELTDPVEIDAIEREMNVPIAKLQAFAEFDETEEGAPRASERMKRLAATREGGDR